MTATADTRALLAACRAAPQDTHAVLLLADAIFEAGRERDAVYLRCTADHDNNAHRHALASLWERGDQERAELVRVQCELARLENEGSEYHHKGCVCTACGPVRRRERALLAAHADRWRLGPACEKCGRSGANYDSPKPGWPKGTYSTNCEACRATGDAGGLMRVTHASTGQIKNAEFDYHYRVEHVRGAMRVHCTLAEAWADGRPTEWVRAVCRHHPVAEVWLTDREPMHIRNPFTAGTEYRWRLPGTSPEAMHYIPDDIFCRVAGYRWPDSDYIVCHPTPELSRLALARAVALAVRLDLEERR